MNQHTTKPGRFAPALFAGGIGLTLAGSSLAHNIEGVLPRITAAPGTFQHLNQMIVEGGATVGLNMVALFAITYAGILATSGRRWLSAGLIVAALVAITWSGATQLGVIAEKTFHVSGGRETAVQTYDNAVTRFNELKAQIPASYKFIDDAVAEHETAIAALKSHHYGSRTAWQTTDQCRANITADASKKLCRAYRLAKGHLATARHAVDLKAKMAKLEAIIAKGKPATVDAGPELIAGVSAKTVSVYDVQVILVMLRSFGIDLAAGLFLATAAALWPTRTGTINPAPARVQTRERSQMVIEHIKAGVHSCASDAHTASALMNTLNTLAGPDGVFKTSYRALSDRSGVSTGAMNDALNALAADGLIERHSSKGRGTTGRVLSAGKILA